MLSAAQLNELYQYAVALCHSRDDAYDLLQAALESYLQAVKQSNPRRGKRGREREKESIVKPEAFVRTLIRNRFIDQYRYKQRWQQESFEEHSAYDISPVNIEQLTIDADSLKKVWQQLSPLDRDILYHWAVLGYNTDEVCEQLGMPRGTLLSRIHRLRKKLRENEDVQLQERLS